ncbi:MAG: hypothetical protein ACKVY0_24445 [Prosthecobacter sp.]|uniref:hypothetical protein n=1 Tax=Prosthecobacter sp. TaxID=1965333 RepID=UPI0038FFA9BE
MKHRRRCPAIRHLRPLSLAWVLILTLLPGCKSERYHKIWRTLDPVGYKHSHSAVFNGSNYQRGIQPAVSPTPSADAMGLEIAR